MRARCRASHGFPVARGSCPTARWCSLGRSGTARWLVKEDVQHSIYGFVTALFRPSQADGRGATMGASMLYRAWHTPNGTSPAR